MIRFLFKVNQPRRFEFKPRFYDESREFIEQRKAVIRREMNLEQSAGGEGLRARLDRAWTVKSRKQDTLKSNRNVMIIAFALFLIAYFLLR